MSFIDGFPKSVTLEQMQAACAALGLPLRNVVSFTSEVRGPLAGLMVVVHVADEGGRKLAGPGGTAILTEFHIPMRCNEGEDSDAAPA